MGPLPRRIFLVDGPNAAGKSTVVNLLRQLHSGSTVISLHDYFHQHVIRDLPPDSPLYRKRHWSDLTHETKKRSEAYVARRERLIIKFIRAVEYDSFVVERGFMTALVYSRLLYGDDSMQIKKSIEGFAAGWASLQATMIYITARPKMLWSRLDKARIDRPERRAAHTPYHLTDRATVLEKHRLYEEVYRRFEGAMMRIDTTELDERGLRLKLSMFKEHSPPPTMHHMEVCSLSLPKTTSDNIDDEVRLGSTAQ